MCGEEEEEEDEVQRESTVSGAQFVLLLPPSVCLSVGRSVGGWRSGVCSSSAFLFPLRYYDTSILILFPSLFSPPFFPPLALLNSS